MEPWTHDPAHVQYAQSIALNLYGALSRGFTKIGIRLLTITSNVSQRAQGTRCRGVAQLARASPAPCTCRDLSVPRPKGSRSSGARGIPGSGQSRPSASPEAAPSSRECTRLAGRSQEGVWRCWVLTQKIASEMPETLLLFLGGSHHDRLNMCHLRSSANDDPGGSRILDHGENQVATSSLPPNKGPPPKNHGFLGPNRNP